MPNRLSQRARRSLIGIVAVLAIAVGGRVLVMAWHRHREQVVSTVTGPTSLLVVGAGDPATPAHTGSLSMLALGDSYTIGQSISPAGRWPLQLAQRLRADHLDVSDPDILAHGGWTTADLLGAMDRAPLRPAYDEVLLLVGVNNQFRGQPIDGYRVQFHTLLQRAITLARGDPRRVVALSIPDWGATPYGANGNPPRTALEIGQFNASALTLCTAAGVAFVNVTPLSEHAATQPALLSPDGLHPSAQQYAQWVELALPAARAALQPGSSTRP